MSTTANARLRGRAAGRDAFDENSLLHVEMQRFGKARPQAAAFAAERGAADAAGFDEIFGDAARGVQRNREADSGCGACGRINRAIDADHFAMRIEQRPAGISPIDCRVCLNRFVNKSVLAGLHGASERADDAGGKRALKAEGIADGENALADEEIARIAERKRDELASRGVNFDQGEIVARVKADEFGFEARTIAESDFNRLRALNHMVIREDVSLGINYEA